MTKKKNLINGVQKVSMVSIRGAITVENNDRVEMLEATKELLTAVIKENHIKLDEIIAIHFTATKDLDAVYPAVAAREIGIVEASLMCFQEMYVQNSLSMCIRIEMQVEKDGLTRKNAIHQYLRGAKVLRPDLAK